jgi:hypothetical protein
MGKKQQVWLSYDLGVEGDYDGLWKWLGEWGAKECGDSLAVLSYSYRTDLAKELVRDIKQDVKLHRRARLYLIYRDDVTRQVKGRFIVGGRRPPQWAEYSQESIEDVEDLLFSDASQPRPRRRVG